MQRPIKPRQRPQESVSIQDCNLEAIDWCEVSTSEAIPAFFVHPPEPSRVTKAVAPCNSCRRRKIKCNEARPSCRDCLEDGYDCSYNPVKSSKSIGDTSSIHGNINSIEEKLSYLSALQARQDHQIDLLQQTLRKRSHDISSGHEKPTLASGNSYVARKSPPSCSNEAIQPSYAWSTHLRQSRSHSERDLIWPSIHRLLPTTRICLYDRILELAGETLGTGPIREPSSEQTPVSTRRSPVGVESASYCCDSGNSVVRGPGGTSLSLELPDTEPLFQSYVKHIHNQHPFLQLNRLSRIAIVSEQERTQIDLILGMTSTSFWATTRDTHQIDQSHRSKKVRRSSEMQSLGDPPVDVSRLERTILSLVCAIGSLCIARDGINSPMAPKSSPSHSTHVRSFTSETGSQEFSSPQANPPESRHRRSSLTSEERSLAGRVQSNPAEVYFLRAVESLESPEHAEDLPYLQANLLAGIYLSLTAKPDEARHYIKESSRMCRVLMESSQSDDQLLDSESISQLSIAFWSCLQLESDVLSEINIDTGNLCCLEGIELRTAESLRQQQLLSSTVNEQVSSLYIHQVQLQRILCDACSELHPKDTTSKHHRRLGLVNALNYNLNSWRKSLTEWAWQDSDHRSSEITVARLRAKYYTIKFIINRPVLEFLLSCQDDSPNHSPSSSTEPRSSKGSLEKTLLQYKMLLILSKQCVEAAISYASVFDKVAIGMLPESLSVLRG